MMTLFGSQTSPFVRRIRLLLAKQEHEFKTVSIFESNDRKFIDSMNPLKLIPILKDDEQVIFDSRVIFQYLQKEKKLHPSLNWQQENLLTIIDGVNDSLVSLLILKRSGNTFSSPHLFFDAQQDRIRDGLNSLESHLQKNSFPTWDYLSICLYSLVDWIDFRQLWTLDSVPTLRSWVDSSRDRPSIKETDPRLG